MIDLINTEKWHLIWRDAEHRFILEQIELEEDYAENELDGLNAAMTVEGK